MLKKWEVWVNKNRKKELEDFAKNNKGSKVQPKILGGEEVGFFTIVEMEGPQPAIDAFISIMAVLF